MRDACVREKVREAPSAGPELRKRPKAVLTVCVGWVDADNEPLFRRAVKRGRGHPQHEHIQEARKHHCGRR